MDNKAINFIYTQIVAHTTNHKTLFTMMENYRVYWLKQIKYCNVMAFKSYLLFNFFFVSFFSLWSFIHGMMVVRSILHSGPIELFLIPSSAPTSASAKAMVCTILSGMVYIKAPLLLIKKSSPCSSYGPSP